MRKSLDLLYTGAAWAGAGCVLAICILMMALAILRLGGGMIRGADDITAWRWKPHFLHPLSGSPPSASG